MSNAKNGVTSSNERKYESRQIAWRLLTMYNGFFTQQSCKNTPSRIISHSTYSRIIEWIRSLWRRCAKLLFPNDNNLPDVAYEEIIMPQYFDSKNIETTAGNYLSTQYLHDRFGLARRDIDSVLPITSNILKFKDIDLLLTDAVAQEPRWPTECKVIQERVNHIDYIPPQPEPYYVSTGREPKPKPVGEEFGTVIFNYSPMSATNYFSRSCSGGTTVLSSSNSNSSYLGDLSGINDNFNNSPSKNHNDLEFESRFESGNLEKVLKITDCYYQLHLRRDMYTQRHMQWFYFRISNTRSRIIYRLSIVNFCKEDSLYNDGLRPLLYSTKDATMHAIGWRRCGDNISYYKNDSSDEEREKHTLTFNITFPHDHDIVYLAHCYPYTYTNLQEYLSAISNDPIKSRFTKLRLLCRTLAGNNVHYLTITAPNCSEDGRKKKGIVITARVHPGETPSSWMMKGIIDFLIGESNQARELRERFIFKLVPMLNPDGVIVGNNRCSLSGKDLNRQYRTVMRESYPSVWHTKLMIRRLMEECGIAMYCDLHAHSRKHNVFIYGCESKRANCYGKLTEQIFPLMLHKNAADKFSFENCKFHIEKGKEGTSRVVVWLMGIQNSYTMEASMGGTTLGSRNGTHFSIQDYEQIGKAFCETLLDFSDDDPTKEKLRNKILVRLIKEGSSADEPTNINLTDYSSDEGDTSDSSSDDKSKLDQINCINSDSSDDNNKSQPCLCVPPPSPQLKKTQIINKLKKLRRKTTAMGEKHHRVKRKLLANRRMVMDLPATDPGSDMYCDLTDDSADENNSQSTTEKFNKNRRSCGASRGVCTPLENAEELKKKSDSECLPLLSAQTLAFNNETIIERVSSAKLLTRSRPVQPPRYMRYLSPVAPRSPDIHMKLTAIKQQIWTGMTMYENSHLDIENSLEKNLLRLETSNLSFYQQNSDALLKSCSKKLMALDYADKFDERTLKKVEKCRKKSGKLSNNESNDEKPIEDVKKCVRKKRNNLRRHKTVININTNSNNGLLDADCDNTELKPLQGQQNDSLRLFGIAKLPKAQLNSNNKTKNNESRRKFRKGGFVANATVHVAKIKSKLLFNDNINNESCSSDDIITTTTTTTTTRLRTSKSRKKNSQSK